MEGVWGQDDHREGHCLSYLLCVSSLLFLGLEEAPMSQGQGPWGPQHLFVLLGHTPQGRASSLGSTANQTLATVPLVPQWPLVAPLFSSPFPWFSKITDLRIPQPSRAWCTSYIRMDSFLALEKCHKAGFYTHRCADRPGPWHVPPKTYKSNVQKA